MRRLTTEGMRRRGEGGREMNHDTLSRMPQEAAVITADQSESLLS